MAFASSPSSNSVPGGIDRSLPSHLFSLGPAVLLSDAGRRPGRAVLTTWFILRSRLGYGLLAIRENEEATAYRRHDGQVREDLQRVLNYFPALGGKPNREAGTLSGGEQQMVAIGRGLMARPQLLMITNRRSGWPPRSSIASWRSSKRLAKTARRSFWSSRMSRWPSISLIAPTCSRMGELR